MKLLDKGAFPEITQKNSLDIIQELLGNKEIKGFIGAMQYIQDNKMNIDYDKLCDLLFLKNNESTILGYFISLCGEYKNRVDENKGTEKSIYNQIEEFYTLLKGYKKEYTEEYIYENNLNIDGIFKNYDFLLKSKFHMIKTATDINNIQSNTSMHNPPIGAGVGLSYYDRDFE